MINIVIEDGIVKVDENDPDKWVVKHPHNHAVLAYCNFKSEAEAARDMINDMARQLRSVGHKVR